jgi:hypothetical protein
MKLFAWLQSLLKRPAPSGELVPFYDVPSGVVARIPPSELRPGCIQARVKGIDEIVWLLPAQLEQGEIRHPPFDEEIRSFIRSIQVAFAEQRDISFEEWEEGFRRDANPEREIAIFSYTADVYRLFTEDEESAERRREVYHLLVACMTTSPDAVWHVVQLKSLSRSEAERIVHRFYGGEKADGPVKR